MWRRGLALWRIFAKHRLDAHLPAAFWGVRAVLRLHPASWGARVDPLGLKHALEEAGVLFLKLGQLLSTRQDLLPPFIIDQLVLLQDKISPVPFDTVCAQIESEAGLGVEILTVFDRFDKRPLATASIAQVHTARLKDGKEVVVKVVRPNLEADILADFDALIGIVSRLNHPLLVQMDALGVLRDYRAIMLDELDLTLEAANARRMRANFKDSALMYVPAIYHVSEKVLVSERIYGLPISRTDAFLKMQYSLSRLAQNGLELFFTQVFYHNFFHADMHAGNVFVETSTEFGPVPAPRYIGLDCAIMGRLDDQTRLALARMLLGVMDRDFDALAHLMHAQGWTPLDVDMASLGRDLRKVISPAVSKSMDELDFAPMLQGIMDVSRVHKIALPRGLIMLLKTLVHVEGMGKALYPSLDIWGLGRPIIESWLKETLNPLNHLEVLQQRAPTLVLDALTLPQKAKDSLHALSSLGAHLSKTERQQNALIKQMRAQNRLSLCLLGAVLLYILL